MAVNRVPQVTVREMFVDDIDAVLRIESSSYDYPWTARIFRDCLRAGYLCRVLERDGEVVGYGLMSYGAGECHVLNLCVGKHCRQLGYGARLLTHFIAWARSHNVASIFLEVRQSNTHACRLYENFGFKTIGVRSNYYPAKDGREDAFVLFLQLRDLTPS